SPDGQRVHHLGTLIHSTHPPTMPGTNTRIDFWDVVYIVAMCYFTALAFVVLACVLGTIAAALSTALFLLDDKFQFPQPVRFGYLLFLITITCFGAAGIVGWLRWPKF